MAENRGLLDVACTEAEKEIMAEALNLLERTLTRNTLMPRAKFEEELRPCVRRSVTRAVNYVLGRLSGAPEGK